MTLPHTIIGRPNSHDCLHEQPHRALQAVPDCTERTTAKSRSGLSASAPTTPRYRHHRRDPGSQRRIYPMIATVFLHQVGERPKEFKRLHAALKYAGEHKITGYIALWTAEDGPEVINLKNGKRPGMKKGSWVTAQ